MEKEISFGKMEQDMKETGEMGWLKGKELFTTLMEMFILESFIKIKQMDLVFILISMEADMRVTGSKISSMVLV
jgi:hypothetical protein